MKKYLIAGTLFIAGIIICVAGIGYYCTQVVNEQVARYQTDLMTMMCDNNRYIAFAPGFDHDGRLDIQKSVKIDQPVIKPGKANEELADFLFSNRHCFSAILTQRAISDVWLLNKTMTYPEENPAEADYGVLDGSSTRVYQMHKDDPQITVRTFEALQCALDRIGNDQKRDIVLVAHDAHFQRAFFDLSAMHPPSKIISPKIYNISYPQSQGSKSWSRREFLFARPYDVYNSLTLPCKCRTAVALPPLPIPKKQE